MRQSLWILQYCGPVTYRQSECSLKDEIDPQSGITIDEMVSGSKNMADSMRTSGDDYALAYKLLRDVERNEVLPRLDFVKSAPLQAELALCICHYISGASLDAGKMPGYAFGIKWLEHLNERGILLGPMDELNWSGRGQHIEYDAEEESQMPLEPKKVLGYSATAVVESVQCRRIVLARKTVKCNKRFTKENVLAEVEHLQRLQHSHIVRLVGTYTLGKSLAILMYPAADTNLEDFMDDISEDEQDDCGVKSRSTRKFFGCLSTAMSFIHHKNVKHMDIKPKNVLVRRVQEGYKVYIADFGIAKAYRSAAESFTDSPTAFTRIYAAPEVVMQDTRGYPADIFSLGCVFMEMYACLGSTSSLNHREQLLGVRGMEYHNHITEVITWYRSISTMLIERYRLLPAWSQDELLTSELNGIVPEMLNKTPSLRPSADSLKRVTAYLGCSVCDVGPEPFEAAERQAGGL